ncbi:hypothetical protein Pcinc_004156 [Petrolisthes cinctipes]|uniref:Uncharacterized protein n=1 Tax=Petrolisthes cinctipes TaxID=88211 RepID=A0AAE1L0J3_PETCI|nr:hypothetical protein Pcinc_004156 [Petrolisthes cinctipes]
MQSHTQEVDYQMEHGLYDQGSPIPSTAKDIAGPSGEGKRKHGGFRNVDLWTTPLTEYFLETVKVHFPDLTGKLQTCSKVWREMHKKMLLVLFRTYRESVTKTGNPRGKVPAHYDLLYSLYGERPLDCPQTVSCGLAPTPTMADPELSQDEEEEFGEQLQLPVEPKAKWRRIRPSSHSERMEHLHTNLLEEFQKQNEFLKEKT